MPEFKELRDQAQDAVAEALGDAYDCTRVWEAWNCGTMDQDDFVLVTDDDSRLAEITDAALSPALAVVDAQAAEIDRLRIEAERYDSAVASRDMEIEHLKRELAVATDLSKQRLETLRMPMDKPNTWPLSTTQFETAAELIAVELAERDGHEGDDKHQLIWEGSPPEPWGEVWQRYIPDAQYLLSAGIAGIQDGERRGITEDAARAALQGNQPDSEQSKAEP